MWEYVDTIRSPQSNLLSVLFLLVLNRIVRLTYCLFLLIGIGNICSAEDTDKFNISFIGIEGELLDNVKKHVRIYAQQQEDVVVTDRVMQRLKKRAITEIKQALEPFGYYRTNVFVEEVAETNELIYRVELNDPVIIRSISIEMDVPTSEQKEFTNWRASYPLNEGDILLQSPYEVAKKSLQSTALRLGYFDAVFSSHQILIDEDRTSADIKLAFVSGLRYTIAATNFEWEAADDADFSTQHLIDLSLLESMVVFENGDPYDVSVLVKTQQNLVNTPYFSTVSVQAGAADRVNSRVPIIVALTPNKRTAYSAEAGVGTDTGIRGGIGYENRRINSKGHNISVRLGGSDIKRSLITNYQIPLARSPKDNINVFAILEEEVGDNREFEQASIGTELTRDWRDSLIKYGLAASREKYLRLEDESDLDSLVETSANLLMPSISWERVESDDLRYPTRGWSASVALRAASDSLASSVSLVQAVIDAKVVRPLGSGRLKARIALGGTIIDEANDIPESLGFLTGGDDSVRGYSYESIGIENDDGVTVGKNQVVGSLEYQHPIKNGFAVATFIDIGDAFNSEPSYKTGAGVGLRWRLPFGALRLDVGSALDLEGDPLRLHFSFGTDL